jgi:uncharacterized protein with PIN domain
MAVSERVLELRKEVEEWVEAHVWMKTDMETPYQCFECGHVYFKGVRLTEDEDEQETEGC